MRGALVVSLLALTGCDWAFGLNLVDGSVAADAPDYAFRKRITLSSPVDSTLTDLPIAVQIKDDADVAAILGEDIAVRTADGRALPFEIEEHEAEGGDLILWVLVDELPGRADTELFLHYGERVGAAPGQDPVTTWPAAYGAVWHFEDETLDGFRDSTRNGNVLRQAVATQRPTSTDGILEDAREFDGLDDTLEAAHHASIDAGSASFTYSIWVRVRTAEQTQPFEMPLYKGGAAITDPGYDLELGTGGWRAQISDGTDGTPGAAGIDGVVWDESSLLDRWVHLAVVVDREEKQLRVYIDGELGGEDLLEERDLTTDAPLVLSHLEQDAELDRPAIFPGAVDELRLYHGVLGADRIRIEYENLARPASVVRIHPHEAQR